MAPRGNNLTGFDPEAFVRASQYPPRPDPWARYEAWRYSGPFSRYNRFKRAFPGLGIATVAFGAYLAYEAVFLKDDHAHGKDHGVEHH